MGALGTEHVCTTRSLELGCFPDENALLLCKRRIPV